VFPDSAPSHELMRMLGLTAEDVATAAREAIAAKH